MRLVKLMASAGKLTAYPPPAAGIAEVSALRNGLSIFGSAAARDLAFGANVTSGQFLVVVGKNNPGSPAAPTVTDTVGTSYTVVTTNDGGGGENTFVAYGSAAASGANTATVTLGAAYSLWFMACTGFTGVHATPADASLTRNGGTSSTPSHSITTGVANALIIGLASDPATNNDAITLDAGDGTVIFEYELGGTNNRGSAIFNIVTTAQAYTIGWDFTTSATWQVGLISFKPA